MTRWGWLLVFIVVLTGCNSGEITKLKDDNAALQRELTAVRAELEAAKAERDVLKTQLSSISGNIISNLSTERDRLEQQAAQAYMQNVYKALIAYVFDPSTTKSIKATIPALQDCSRSFKAGEYYAGEAPSTLRSCTVAYDKTTDNIIVKAAGRDDQPYSVGP